MLSVLADSRIVLRDLDMFKKGFLFVCVCGGCVCVCVCMCVCVCVCVWACL